MGLNMNHELKKRFDAVEKIVLDALVPCLRGYSVQVNIRDISTLLYDNNTDDSPYYVMDVLFSSVKYEKILKFDFSNGADKDNEYSKSVDFLFKNGKKWFSFEDYLKFRNIKQKCSRYFQAEDTEDTLKEVKTNLEQIVFLLQQDDIKHILYSEDWIHVPHDKSMYF